MILFSDNYLERATLTPSSEVPSLPAENIFTEQRSQVWRTTDNDTENLVIHLAAADATSGVTSCHIINDNIESPTTLTLEANTSNSWGAPPFSEVITLDDGNSSLRNLIHTIMFAVENYEWWRLVIANGPNDSGFFDIGKMYLGNSLIISKSFAPEWKERSVDPSIVSRSISNQDYVQIFDQWREFEVSFPARITADMLSIRDIFRRVGIGKNIYVAFNYDDDPNELTVYGKFVNMNEVIRRLSTVAAIPSLVFKESL